MPTGSGPSSRPSETRSLRSIWTRSRIGCVANCRGRPGKSERADRTNEYARRADFRIGATILTNGRKSQSGDKSPHSKSLAGTFQRELQRAHRRLTRRSSAAIRDGSCCGMAVALEFRATKASASRHATARSSARRSAGEPLHAVCSSEPCHNGKLRRGLLANSRSTKLHQA